MVNEVAPTQKDRVRQLIDGDVVSNHEFVNYLIPQAKDIESKYNQCLGKLQEVEKEGEQIKITLLGLRGQLVKTIEDIRTWDSKTTPTTPEGGY